MRIDRVKKAELHCHIDGLLCPEYIRSVQEKGFCPGLNLREMERFYPVTNLSEWFRLGGFLSPHEQGRGDMLLEVLKLYLRDLVKQNVTYAEIMLCSFLDTGDEIMDRLMGEFRKAGEDLPGIDVGYLWALGRTPDHGKFEKKVRRVVSLWRKGYIDGLALAGDEKACRVKEYSDIFLFLSQEGIPVEIHAGEWCGPDSIWDALEYGKPRRIGHALSLFEDPELPKYFSENDIHIEFCPTSNMKVGGVKRIEEHPLFRAMDYDLNFSINTDDPGHFECSMNSEFDLIDSCSPLTGGMAEKIYSNSLRSAFGEGAKRAARQFP